MIPPGAHGMMRPSTQPHRPNLPPNATPVVNPRKQRELYVGNLPREHVSESMLRELFNQIILQCEDFDARKGAAVLALQLRVNATANGGTFAFIEFRDEQVMATVATFNGMELYGRNLKISHPNGYVPPAAPIATLRVPERIMTNFGLRTYEAMRRQDRATPELAVRKGRTLYVGNLAIGMVTAPMLTELFTYPLQKLDLGEASTPAGPPVIDAKVDPSGKFGFVEFADDMLATMALAVFNKMPLCGRPLCVDRPAGYTADMSRPLPPGRRRGVPGSNCVAKKDAG